MHQVSINRLSTYGLVLDKETPRGQRARLDTGPFCNYKCEFCYYKDHLDESTNIEVILKRIDRIHAYGIKQIDLSGGESSVSPDWFEVLDYCSTRFEHISCLSHGGTFANQKFLKKSYEHGLREILFSLHGANAETHDAITGVRGSFGKILLAIRNAQSLDMRVRLNCTVYRRNYHELDDQYAGLVNMIMPHEINFITLNYFNDAEDMGFSNVTYSDMTTAIKSCIDKVARKVIINVRYVPYCYMQGYEQYVCNQYQHIYDPYDWNKELYTDTLNTATQYTDDQKLQLAYNEAARQRIMCYDKSLACRDCKYFYICDGVEKQISEHTPFNPVAGEPVKQVNFYRQGHFK